MEDWVEIRRLQRAEHVPIKEIAGRRVGRLAGWHRAVLISALG